MNLDELQSVQARERQSSDLQHLRSSFYREVGEYIDELTDRRSALVEEVDKPFSSPEVRQLSDDIETAEQTVEAIYERRVGKVVKKASIAAAGMPVDDDGLTEEEEVLFEALVDRIERNRETVLSVLDGETPTVPDVGGSAPDVAPGDRDVGRDAEPDDADATPPEDADVEPGGVDAADLMGGDEGDADTGTAPGGRTPTEPGGPDEDGASGDRTDGDRASAQEFRGDEPAPGTPDSTASTTSTDDESESGAGDIPGVPRTTVRITADVGEVVGADNRDYDLGREDVVTLPEANADVLVEKDAAERLE